MGTLFLTKEMPEPPKQGFFKGLFGGGPSILDKEELCKSIIPHCPSEIIYKNYIFHFKKNSVITLVIKVF